MSLIPLRSFFILLISVLFLPAGSALGSGSLPSVFKSIPEEYTNPVAPNVLLLIDTSGSMLFNLTGSHTYGDGSGPFNGQFYYGRDTNNSNNDPDDGSLSYYPPATYLTQDQVTQLGTNRINRANLSQKNGSYLYPNDSRMYILKKVLWTIFTDPSMVEGLKIGLSTYHQDRRYAIPDGSYTSYEFWGSSGSTRYRQGLSWQPTGQNKALMRLPFGLIPPFSYSSLDFTDGVPDAKIASSQWYKLLALIDGVETSKNDELRAVGGTPLEKSIYTEGVGWESFYLPNEYREYDSSVSPPLDKGSKIIGWQPYPNQIDVWYPGEDVARYDFRYRQGSDGHVYLCTRQYDTAQKRWVWHPPSDPEVGLKLHQVSYTEYKRKNRGNFPMDCAYSFIQSSIEYPCQDNWLIVLTDGEDSDPKADPADAVKKLYNAVSDDNWPKPLGKTPKPVRTFVIGLLDKKSDNLDKMALEGKAWEVNKDIKKTAYYATDTDSLLKAFRLIFSTIQSNRSSSAPPRVQSNLGDEDNVVYAASFAPKTDGAWPGYLYKKTLSSTGKYDTIWDGSNKIKAWDIRPVYTAPWYGSSDPPVYGTNLKMFPTGGANASVTALSAGVPSGQADNFVRWIRGGGWNHGENRAHPMIDMYRGDLLVMGPPPGSRPDADFRTFSYENRSRDKVVFVQGNGGMLQVIDDNKGDELLGFIPPNVLHHSRIAGLVDNIKDREMGSSRYLLAGPMVVEDVKVKFPYGTEEYRTMLLGSLGYGGTGLYALDVTDPIKPSFIWARDSLVYSDNSFLSGNNGLLWEYAHNGSSLTSGDNETPALRRVIGRPFIGWVKDWYGTKQWIALFGAGAASTVKNSDGSVSFQHPGDVGGRAIYALKMSDGSVFKSLSNDKMGQVIADLAVTKEQGRLNYLKISRAFVGDTQGGIWRLDWKDPNPDDWALDLIADLSNKDGSPPMVHRLDLSLKGKQRWIFAATGDPYDLVPRSSRVISTNCMVGFKEPLKETHPNALTRDDLKPLLRGDDYLAIDDKEEGWIIPMLTGEFATTPPIIYKGGFFGSTYISSEGNPCEQGLSRLYAINAFNGKGFFDDKSGGKKRHIELKGIKITGMEVKDNKIVMGILNPAGKKVEDLGLEAGIKAVLDSDGAILSIEVPLDGLQLSSMEDVTRSGYWRRLW